MQIQLQTLKAAHIAAAVKDVRFYLNGVLVEFRAQNDVGDVKAVVVGTDGCMLFAAHTIVNRDDESETVPDVGTQIIIPGDVVKACKLRHKSNPFVTLKQISETQWQLGDVLFTPIDGKFPDYRRVIPQYSDVNSAAQEVTMHNPDVLVRARDALKLYTGESKSVMYPIAQRGNDASVMHTGDTRAVVVIMPLRNDAVVYSAKYQGFAD